LLRPEQDLHKCLISSPANLIAEYDESDLLITHAFPSVKDSILRVSQREGNPFSRYYYICVFRIDSPEPAEGLVVPDHSHVGNLISIALSIFYGKRFDNHGVIESHGRFSMPLLNEIAPTMKYYYFGSNNHQPRKNLSIELDLRNCKPIIDFLIKKPNDQLKQTFFTAGKFYLSSLQSADTDMEKAFLDLVTCGEILSNYFQYSEDEIYDSRLQEMLGRLVENKVNQKDIELIKSRLYQVRARFSLTFKKLLNERFFDETESLQEFTKLTIENIESCIKAVYDLRSKYVHTGIDFGHWLVPHRAFMNEIQLGKPSVEDNELKKILSKVPTYIGLERVMRFALLRLLHINNVYIHAELDNNICKNRESIE
jgi:Apea-like HEPN